MIRLIIAIYNIILLNRLKNFNININMLFKLLIKNIKFLWYDGI